MQGSQREKKKKQQINFRPNHIHASYTAKQLCEKYNKLGQLVHTVWLHWKRHQAERKRSRQKENRQTRRRLATTGFAEITRTQIQSEELPKSKCVPLYLHPYGQPPAAHVNKQYFPVNQSNRGLDDKGDAAFFDPSGLVNLPGCLIKVLHLNPLGQRRGCIRTC